MLKISRILTSMVVVGTMLIFSACSAVSPETGATSSRESANSTTASQSSLSSLYTLPSSSSTPTVPEESKASNSTTMSKTERIERAMWAETPDIDAENVFFSLKEESQKELLEKINLVAESYNRGEPLQGRYPGQRELCNAKSLPHPIHAEDFTLTVAYTHEGWSNYYLVTIPLQDDTIFMEFAWIYHAETDDMWPWDFNRLFNESLLLEDINTFLYHYRTKTLNTTYLDVPIGTNIILPESLDLPYPVTHGTISGVYRNGGDGYQVSIPCKNDNLIMYWYHWNPKNVRDTHPDLSTTWWPGYVFNGNGIPMEQIPLPVTEDYLLDYSKNILAQHHMKKSFTWWDGPPDYITPNRESRLYGAVFINDEQTIYCKIDRKAFIGNDRSFQGVFTTYYEIDVKTGTVTERKTAFIEQPEEPFWRD